MEDQRFTKSGETIPQRVAFLKSSSIAELKRLLRRFAARTPSFSRAHKLLLHEIPR
jgi:hypothetical protein